jgi:hypothetical protein
MGIVFSICHLLRGQCSITPLLMSSLIDLALSEGSRAAPHAMSFREFGLLVHERAVEYRRKLLDLEHRTKF